MSKLAAKSAPPRAPWSLATAVRHVLNLAPMILVHVGAVAVLFTGGTWTQFLLVLPLLICVRGLLVTVGYHRYFSHRCFKTSRVAQFILAVLCCGNLQHGPLWWAAYHRRHHRNSDEIGDPHSPFHGGFWWAYCGWLFIPLDPEWRTVSDLRRFPELVRLERLWQLPGLLLAWLCWQAGGANLLCVGFCLSAVVVFQLTFAVNTIAHLLGSRRYATSDNSRNSFLLALVSFGDGWHNNHHHYPNSAQAGFFWWEFDPSYRLIKLLEWLGIVWNVHEIPHHKRCPSVAAASSHERITISPPVTLPSAGYSSP